MQRKLTAVGMLTLILCAADVGAQDRSDKPWRGRISAGGGWNSNPATIGTTVSFGTPTSGVPFVNNQDAAFSRITFDGSYDLIQTEKDLLTVGYGIHTDLYEQDVEEVDSIRQNAWIGYQRKIVEDLAVSLQFADEYIHVDGKGFSNALLLEPSAYWRFAEWGSIQVKHQIGFINYLLPLLPGPMIDRDGTFHDLGFTVFFDVPKTDLQIRAGYRHRWTFTEGGNGGFFDKDSDTFVIGATHPLPFDITADFSFTRQWDDYNGIGPAAGVGREDRVDFFSILLTRPVIPNVQVYVRYDAVNDESNAGLFDYR